MIELLGVGVHDTARGWQLRRVTTTLGSPVSVVSMTPDCTDCSDRLLSLSHGRLVEGAVTVAARYPEAA